jgi:GNAT superfamily N-acetyltransferase
LSDPLRDVLYRALVPAAPPWLRFSRRGKRELHEGVAFVAQDLPGPSFNKVTVLGPSPPLDRLLERAAAFYAGRDDGFGVLVEADAGHPLEAELRARGWRVEEDEPALVMPDIPASPPMPVGLEVSCVADEAGLDALRDTAAAGFGSPPEMSREMAPSLAYARDPDIALMLGTIDGRPVGTAMCFCLGGVAWIAGVTVMPADRRRGLGTALTWAALAEGARRGCTAAALNSGPMSLGLYRRMGFVWVCNHRTYAAPAPSPGPG